MAIRSGSFRASNPKGVAFLFQLLFVFLMPLAFVPALLPLGVEARCGRRGGPRASDLFLLSLAECAVVAYLYRLVLTWQGHVLQAREQRILEIVAAKAE